LSGSQILLGPPADALSVSQAYVDIELRDGSKGLGPYGSGSDLFGFGSSPYNQFLLDTGANDISVVSDAAQELVDNGLQSVGMYSDLGVGGLTAFNLSAPYQLNFTDSNGQTITLPQTSQDVRVLTNPSFDFGMSASDGGIPGVLGMPAMVGRVTTLDTSAEASYGTLGVSFSNTVPAGNGDRFTVATDTRVTFDPRDGLPAGSPANAPLPTWAPVTFVTATLEYNGKSVSGAFLVDTGAQMSDMSTALASSLGLDLSNPVETIPVAGVGGTVNVPVLAVDQLSLSTQQGPQLVWSDPVSQGGIDMMVQDIAPGIDGVFGADMLSGGVTTDWDTLETTGSPYFDTINLDFRNLATQGTGQIDFNVDPQYLSNVRTWTAAGGGNWSTAANWSAGVTPQSGNILMLQAASSANMVNDLPAGQTLGAVSLSGNLTISGNSVVLNPSGGTAIGDVAGVSTFGLNSQLASNATVQVAAGQLTISGGLGTNGYQLSVDAASGAGGYIIGAITGTGGLSKLGSGTLTISGANSYSGGTVVTAGTLIVTGSQSLPDGTNLTVGAGAASVFGASTAGVAVSASPALAATDVAHTVARRGTPDVVLPLQLAAPTLLPPEARKLDRSLVIVQQSSLVKSSAVSRGAVVLPPAAADSVHSAGVYLPISYVADLWPFAETSDSANSTRDGTPTDAALLLRMSVLPG
jgi:autotransporter-associated beta strand protein